MFPKNLSTKPFLFIFFSLSFSVFAFDQFLKHKIRSIGGFYVCNHGISFGILLPFGFFWLILAFFVLSACYFFFLKFVKKRIFFIDTVALALFSGGVLSNIFDRIAQGCVLDYFSLNRFWHFLPIFNFADVAIFLGSCLFVLNFFLKYHPKPE